jgi:hypothetical protein
MASRVQTGGDARRTVSLLLPFLLLTAVANATFAGNPILGGATVTLLDLVQTYDGEPKPVTVATAPPGLPVALFYDGSALPPSEPGSYTVWGLVLDPFFPVLAKDILTISPAITNITAPPAGTYRVGQTLEFSVAYCGDVSVSTNEGIPSLSLRIGESLVEAVYTGDEQTSVLVFRYTIQEGDRGEVVMPEIISRNGATIQDSGGYDAVTYFSPASTSEVMVDAVVVPAPPAGDVLQFQPVSNRRMRLTVIGTSKVNYVIQAVADLSLSDWVIIGAVQADTNGVAALDVPLQPGSQFFRSMRVDDGGDGFPR